MGLKDHLIETDDFREYINFICFCAILVLLINLDLNLSFKQHVHF